MKQIIKYLQFTLLLTLLALAPAANAAVAVVAHPDSPFASISEKAAKKLFLGKSKSVGGVKATPVDQEDGMAARDEFYSRVVKKSSAKLKAYWSRQIFSGKGTPPAVVGGDGEVKAWLGKNHDGIGYIDASQVDSSVKVLIEIP